MMKCEFEKLIGHEIDVNSYSTIEYVYSNHPSIDEIEGKQQIATIYKIGGMVIIRDMYETAKKACEIHNLILRANSLRDRLNDALCCLISGNEPDLDIENVKQFFNKI